MVGGHHNIRNCWAASLGRLRAAVLKVREYSHILTVWITVMYVMLNDRRRDMHEHVLCDSVPTKFSGQQI